MSHFFAFFDVWANISAPVARHGRRLWQIKARAWSLYLPKSQPGRSHWHLQITETSMGDCFLVMLGHFSVLFLGCHDFLVLGNASLAKAGAWSLYLLKSQPGRSHWHLHVEPAVNRQQWFPPGKLVEHSLLGATWFSPALASQPVFLCYVCLKKLIIENKNQTKCKPPNKLN